MYVIRATSKTPSADVYKLANVLSNQHALIACSFPQSMIARLVLNLLKSRDTIAVLKRSTAFDAFPLWHTRIFLNVWKQ